MVKGGTLEITLCELEEQSENAFLCSLQGQVNNALSRIEAPPRDLSPTPAINHLLLLLREILTTTSINEGRDKIWNKVCIHFSLRRALYFGRFDLCLIIVFNSHFFAIKNYETTQVTRQVKVRVYRKNIW